MMFSPKQEFLRAVAAADIGGRPDLGFYCFEGIVDIAIPPISMVPFEIPEDEIYILGLFSREQATEQRHGSRAMAFLGKLADEFQLSLTLNPLGIGPGAPPREKLFEFYRKQGFEPVEGDGGFMRRKPQDSSPVQGL